MQQGPLSQLAYAAIDFESAGAAPGETDQPVQIGIVRVEKLFGEPKTWVTYLAAGRPIHWAASRIHGITTDRLAGAPSFLSVWPRVHELLAGAVVVGHNLATEKRYLRAFPGHSFGPWLDTLTLARATIPNCPDYGLGALAATLGLVEEVDALSPGGHWHDALYDAAASLCLLRCVVRELELSTSPLEALGNAVKLS